MQYIPLELEKTAPPLCLHSVEKELYLILSSCIDVDNSSINGINVAIAAIKTIIMHVDAINWTYVFLVDVVSKESDLSSTIYSLKQITL